MIFYLLRLIGGGGGVIFDEVLSNNVFETVGTLQLPPHAGEIGFAGIRVNNASPVTVGEVGYPQNQFLDLDFGIIAENSLVTVENALFQSPTLVNPFAGMVGVQGHESDLYVKSSIFNKCFTGVASVATNLYVEPNNYFTSNTFGVDITNSLKRAVRVVGNFFTDTKSTGINAVNNGGNFEEFIIENNEIEMDFSPIAGFPADNAVNLQEAVNITQINASISSNDPIEMFGARAGVNVTLNRSIDINDNIVDIFVFTTTTPPHPTTNTRHLAA